jgi:hypothetical protein
VRSFWVEGGGSLLRSNLLKSSLSAANEAVAEAIRMGVIRVKRLIILL